MASVEEQVDQIMAHMIGCEQKGRDWFAHNAAFPNLVGIAPTRDMALSSMRKKITRAVAYRHRKRVENVR